MRKITVLSTLVGNKQITTDATTFEQLHNDLIKMGLEIGSYKFVVGQTSTTLELPTAVLPTSDFTLVVTPLKTKAGASYQEMKTFVKQARENALNNDDSDVLEIINEYGNYTQLATAEMTELYDELMEYFEEVEMLEMDDEDDCICDEIARLQERVTQLEILANVVTPENEDEFYAAKQAEVQNVINQLEGFTSKNNSNEDFEDEDYDDEYED